MVDYSTSIPAIIKAYPVVDRRLRGSLAYAASTKQVRTVGSVDGKALKKSGRAVVIIDINMVLDILCTRKLQ